MAIKRCLMLLHLPQMHVMHVAYAFDAPHCFHHLAAIYLWRAAQHQCSDRTADFGEGQPQYVKRDTDGYRRIDPAQIVEDDQRPPDDNRDRGERVRQVVQKEGADVHAALLHRPGKPGRQAVHDQRDGAEYHDRPALHLGRVDHAHPTFVDQIEADEDQRRVIDQGGHDLDPAIAEGHVFVRRAPRNLARGKGDQQRCHVGEIMQCIGNQGEAAGQDTADDLRDGQKRVRPDRDGDAPVA